MKKNQYGHIVEGQTNIKNFWKARDTIVGALNSLRIMTLTMPLNQERKGIEKIIRRLEIGLKKISRTLGIGNYSKDENEVKA